MSFRVFFLCLLPCSWAWSAGVSIELTTSVSIGSVTYTDTDNGGSGSIIIGDIDYTDTDNNEAGGIIIGDIDLQEGPYGFDPEPFHEVKPALRSIQSRVKPEKPSSIDLESISESRINTEFGTESVQYLSKSFHSFQVADKQVVNVNDGKLYGFTNEGQMHAYILDFDADVTSHFEFPTISNGVKSFDTYKYSYRFGPNVETEDGTEVEPEISTRAWPKVVDTKGYFMSWVDNKTSADPFQGGWYIENNDEFELRIPAHVSDARAGLFPVNHSLLDDPEFLQQGDSLGFFMSFDTGSFSGLWSRSGSTVNGETVSAVTLSESKLLDSHLGKLQLYILATGEAVLRMIQYENSPVFSFTSTGSEGIFDITSTYGLDGTLLTINTESELDDLWWIEGGDGSIYRVNLPAESVKVEMCDSNANRFFCVIQHTDSFKLYELIDGELIEDRILNHEWLVDGLIAVHGIYAFHDNRFVSIETVNLENNLFNFTEEGAYHVRKAPSYHYDMETNMMDSNEDGVFFWVSTTQSGMYAFRIEGEVPKEPDSGSIGLLDPDEIGGGVDFLEGEERELEEVEENKEIPRAELSGAFSLFVILNMLLIISYRRKVYDPS